MPLNFVNMQVVVDVRDVDDAKRAAVEEGHEGMVVTVSADVDIDEALEEATVEQLREALGRELPGYTADQLVAIEACLNAVAAHDMTTASAMLPRIFEHTAQIEAAERAIHANHFRSVAA
ncbi:hypothetical protein GCM10011349_20350 [Novosphingobium indicum]|uniref:Uncharacterized protein n=1 Tax=Novosphingobium indicum TaxID=462949 RepID=A0ABQ2JPF6_9SPHN|nr:hypothetical protein [Novosphingobium indicum]GGN49576.1 hypothetical protein GCM10011349_20350 [Novosphingobium indicum]